MTAIANLPDLRPSLLLDFANSGRVDPRVKFTRASSATCFGPDGKLRTVATNVPRIDYDPVTGKCLGLLLEPSRTNLLKYSEQFDNGAWIKSIGSPTISPNTATAPDGTTTADKLIEDTLAGAKLIRQIASLTANKTYTLSVFAKAGERSHISISHANQSNWSAGGELIINLASGTVHSNAISGSIVSIRSVGAGWYLCSLTLAFGTIDAVGGMNIGINNGTSITYQGDGTSGIYIWGAQLEEGSYPTSYIPTEASSVTRAAETALMSGTNFTSWYRQDEGTLLAESSVAAYSKNTISEHNTVYINDGTTQNRMGVRAFADSIGNLRWNSTGYAGGVTQWDSTQIIESTPNTLVKNALTYIKDSVANSVNGSVTSVDTSAEIPNLTQINFGSTNSFASNTQHIRRIAYYPRRITNKQLQRITA